MKFEDVIGQEALKEHMQSAIRLGKISHAYIINGEAGFFKKLLAEAFAQALLCSKLNPDYDKNQVSFPGLEAYEPKLPEVIEPCCECISCKKASHHNHPDIIYISHEKPNLISKEEIRNQLVNTVDIIPYESKRKIYIIEDGQLMNEAGQNTLLKTIEEPPDFVTIIILTTNKEKLLPTVLSRCVCLDVKPVKKSEIRSYLMDKGIVDYQADMAINFAEGNPGKALMIASDIEFQNRRKLIINTIRDFDSFNSKRIADMAKKIEEDKDNIDSYFDLIMVFLRDVLVYKTTGDEKRVHFREEISVIRDISRHKLSQINELINITKDAKEKVNYQVTLGLTIEMMLHKMKETV